MYDSAEQWWQACRSQAPWAIAWRHIPASRREAARRDAFTVLRDLRAPDGTLTRTLTFACTTGRKPWIQPRQGGAAMKNALPVRSPLDALALEFPQYRIFMHSIGDRLFYLAEAMVPHVQPRLRRRKRLTVCVIN